MPSYSNPSHPEHREWLTARRKRFTAILREGKRCCKLSPDEREKVIELCNLIEKNTKELENESATGAGSTKARSA